MEEEQQHPTTPFLHLPTTITRLSPLLTTSITPMEEPPPQDASSSSSTQSEWVYSKPVVFLDVIWNLAFLLVSAVLLLSTVRERPSTPLRIWIAGYALQCFFHVGFVYFEYKRRNQTREGRDGDGVDARGDVDELFTSSPHRRCQIQTSVVKRLESANTIVTFVWWMIGFYWIVIGGQALLQDAPHLYWLAVVFLAFDVFFAIFCILLACIVGVALCCCLPCILAILYAVAVREGATEYDISLLPRYRYCQLTSSLDRRPEAAVPILEPNSASEITLQPEDSECCICLSQYVDGVELHSLPCNHHFHCGCITKWLRINATCPLCKYNILNADELV